jgi:hypothetical protein
MVLEIIGTGATCMTCTYAWRMGTGQGDEGTSAVDKQHSTEDSHTSDAQQALRDRAWGTWGMRSRQAELDTAQGLQGTRAQRRTRCTSMAGQEGLKEQDIMGMCTSMTGYCVTD